MTFNSFFTRFCATVTTLLAGLAMTVDHAFGQTDYSQDLVDVRSQIEALQTKTAQTESERASVQARLKQINEQIVSTQEQKQTTLQTLQEEDLSQQDSRRTKYQQLLELEQQTAAFELTAQAYYKISKLDNLAIALRDQDVNTLTRTRAYLEYLSRSQANQIRELHRSLSNIDSDDSDISLLAGQRSELSQQLTGHMKTRKALKQKLAALDEQLKTNHNSIRALQKHEAQLVKQESAAQSEAGNALSNSKPAAEITFHAPLDAPIVRRFGDPKELYGKQWDGVLYQVEPDLAVKSSAPGTVIFAKAHKTLGLLVIIDHGHEIFSLYAHNKELVVSLGESVTAQQTIARTGDSGDVNTPSLYFELRESGQPIDPLMRFAG